MSGGRKYLDILDLGGLKLLRTANGLQILSTTGDDRLTAFDGIIITGLITVARPVNTLIINSVDGGLYRSLNGAFPSYGEIGGGGGGGGTPFESLTASETIVAGEIVAFTTSGEVQLATAANLGKYLALGVAKTSALAPNLLDVYSTDGSIVPIEFDVAPGALTNGSIVYLSDTPGKATITLPLIASRAQLKIGLLRGANGISTTPLTALRIGEPVVWT